MSTETYIITKEIKINKNNGSSNNNNRKISKYNTQFEPELLYKFIASVSIRNEKTAMQYHSRLLVFEKFVEENYNDKK